MRPAVNRNRASTPSFAQGWASAALACLGVVFGDIRTSPLYTLSVAAKAASSGGTVSADAVLGILSLIFWSLIIVISIKYAVLIMRADNHGEGGILSLLALVSPRRGALLFVDLIFVVSTSAKFLDGGWLPLLLALVIAFLMLTWRNGEEIMDAARLAIRLRSKDVIDQIKANPPFRVPGTAVVLGRMARGVPLAITQNLKLNRVLHQKVLLVAVVITETPRVFDEDRVVVTPISHDFTRIELRFGFMENPDVPIGES
jgi:KUP system potassium uptake protein